MAKENQGDGLPKNNEFEELLHDLPKQKNWDGRMMCKYKETWFSIHFFRSVWASQKNFKARGTDIILATMPKSGTTWLKALSFSVLNRHLYASALQDSPLLTHTPHELIPFLEFDAYKSEENPNLDGIPSPRIFTLHFPYEMLPESILESGCKIVYVCRNPLDQFVSHWHFSHENILEPEAKRLSLEEAFDMYCNGINPYGPIWNHILGYWNASVKNSGKILFLKYEEMKKDTVSCLKKLAEFIGLPFSEEEEKKGMIDEIVTLCSIEKMKSLDVNKEGKWNGILANSSFFRKGEVGDWENTLTSSMGERMEKVLVEKFRGSGLTFN